MIACSLFILITLSVTRHRHRPSSVPSRAHPTGPRSLRQDSRIHTAPTRFRMHRVDTLLNRSRERMGFQDTTAPDKQLPSLTLTQHQLSSKTSIYGRSIAEFHL